MGTALQHTVIHTGNDNMTNIDIGILENIVRFLTTTTHRLNVRDIENSQLK